MFNDIRTSAETVRNFKESLQTKSTKMPVDLSVQILTMGFWPMQLAARCNLPKEAAQATEIFTEYYMSVHNGRRLSWQTNMGNADVLSMFGGKKFEINMPTYMMCIVLLFNEAPQLTFKEIAEATQIPVADLKRNLLMLSFGKLPVLTKLQSAFSKKIEDADIFTPANQFKSKLFRVKIAALASATNSEPTKSAEVRSEVDEERQYLIDACIVRIMKTRRTMEHLALVNETTRQLSARFLPNPVLIKKRIESLIEREYMERSRDNRMIYNYLA